MKARTILWIATIATTAVVGITVLVLNRGTGDSSWLTTKSSDGAPAVKPYDVEFSPGGNVHFDRLPQRVVTMDANYLDMLVAIRQEQKVIATGYPDNDFDGFYRALGGPKVRYNPAETSYLSTPGGGMFDKELLYSLRADIHHIDPLQLASMRGWSRADVDEIARNVGPFVANRYSRDNNYPGTEPYRYYTIWELSEKIAEVYQQPGRIQQLKAVYDEMVHSIQTKLPPERERPRVGLVYHNNGKFTIYNLANEGFGQAQYRDVGARDAFSSISDRAYGGTKGGAVGIPLDAEGLLALNPDVLIMPFAMNPGGAGVSFEQMKSLKTDPVLQRVNAFRDDRIYPGGTPLQGPIFYLFHIEMAAKQIYPEIFGDFRKDLDYPKSEWLFDREKVATILGETTGSENGQR